MAYLYRQTHSISLQSKSYINIFHFLVAKVYLCICVCVCVGIYVRMYTGKSETKYTTSKIQQNIYNKFVFGDLSLDIIHNTQKYSVNLSLFYCPVKHFRQVYKVFLGLFGICKFFKQIQHFHRIRIFRQECNSN